MNNLPFVRKNYQLMILGVIILIVGFTIMSSDKTQHGFGFLGLTLGPIVVLTGFVVEIFAIIHSSEKENK